MSKNNLVTASYPYFMSHPFWTLLRIHPQQGLFQALKKLSHTQQYALIKEAVQGFYPVSYASLLAFKRFSDLAEHPDSKAIAYEIYLVEKGEKPLITGSDMTGVLHCDQLKILFESVIGEPLSIHRPEDFEVLQETDIPHASLLKAMAICDLIENTAPYVIHFYQDFLIQCQLALSVPSESVRRNYLDEHNLTEGDACEEQHIDMLDRMKGHYRQLCDSEDYEREKLSFIRLVNIHFERHRNNIMEILGSGAEA